MRLGRYRKELKRRGDRYMLEIIDSKDTRSLKDKRWEKKRVIQSIYFLLAFVVASLSILVWQEKINSQVYSLFIGFILGVVFANITIMNKNWKRGGIEI